MLSFAFTRDDLLHGDELELQQAKDVGKKCEGTEPPPRRHSCMGKLLRRRFMASESPCTAKRPCFSREIGTTRWMTDASWRIIGSVGTDKVQSWANSILATGIGNASAQAVAPALAMSWPDSVRLQRLDSVFHEAESRR